MRKLRIRLTTNSSISPTNPEQISSETNTSSADNNPNSEGYNNKSEILVSIANIDPQQIDFDIQNPTGRRNSANSYL